MDDKEKEKFGVIIDKSDQNKDDQSERIDDLDYFLNDDEINRDK